MPTTPFKYRLSTPIIKAPELKFQSLCHYFFIKHYLTILSSSYK